jgi:hypothetical protein
MYITQDYSNIGGRDATIEFSTSEIVGIVSIKELTFTWKCGEQGLDQNFGKGNKEKQSL